MKSILFLPFLSWLLLALVDSKSPLLVPPTDVHPDDLMKTEGQFKCLENDPLNMDLLLRHEARLEYFPEVTVGCETISPKPLKTHEVQPGMVPTLNETVRKYFVIDVSGVEQKLEEWEPVIIETKASPTTTKMTLSNPEVGGTTKKRQYDFSQVCFPRACFASKEAYKKTCKQDFQRALIKAELELDCVPGFQDVEEIDSECGITPANGRELLKGHTGPIFGKQETSVYCIGNGPTLGPMRTPKYPTGQVFSSSRRSIDFLDQFLAISNLDSSHPWGFRVKKEAPYLVYSYDAYVTINDKKYMIGCALLAPLTAPYNRTYGINHMISRGSGDPSGTPIHVKEGEEIDLKKLYSSFEKESWGSSQIVRFEDLCYPPECQGIPREGYKCKGKYGPPDSSETLSTLTYNDHDDAHRKYLWPFRPLMVAPPTAMFDVHYTDDD